MKLIDLIDDMEVKKWVLYFVSLACHLPTTSEI